MSLYCAVQWEFTRIERCHNSVPHLQFLMAACCDANHVVWWPDQILFNTLQFDPFCHRETIGTTPTWVAVAPDISAWVICSSWVVLKDLIPHPAMVLISFISGPSQFRSYYAGWKLQFTLVMNLATTIWLASTYQWDLKERKINPLN